MANATGDLAMTGSPAPMASRPAWTEPPLRFKLAWGVGQLAPMTIFAVISAELMLYMTDHVGLAPAAVGAALFAVRIYDIFTDLAIGVLSDRYDTRWGRRRPWMLAGTLLITVGTVMLFRVDLLPPDQVMTATTIWLLVFYTGYSAFLIPLIAMGAEVCPTYQSRTSLQAYALVFAIIASLLGNALAPALIIRFGGGTDAFRNMGLTMALVPLVAGLMTVIGTGGAPKGPARTAPKLNAGMWVRTLVTSQPLLILALAKLGHFFATSTAVGAMVYYAIYVLDIGQAGMVVFGTAASAGGVAGVLIGSWVARGRKKHHVYSVALGGMAFAFLAFGLIPRGSVAWFAVPSFAMTAFAAPALMMAQSMLADIVEWDRLRFGQERAGAVSSLVTALQKTTPALSALVIGLMLSWGGYVTGRPGAPQPESAITMISLSVTVLPFLILLAACVPMMLFYRLDEAALQRARDAAA